MRKRKRGDVFNKDRKDKKDDYRIKLSSIIGNYRPRRNKSPAVKKRPTATAPLLHL